MKGVGYVLFVVVPKVLFHSALGVILVACLSYMCIAIVAMMSKGGGQQGESYSLYMLISAAWFCANHGTLSVDTGLRNVH